MQPTRSDIAALRNDDRWLPWTVHWSAIWVGVLAALVTGLILGLIGIALGAHQIGPGRILRWSDVGFGALLFSVAGAFFSFVVGAWVAAKIAGLRRSETAMLHGAIVWLLAVPFLVVFAALGAGSYFGGWYGGLAGAPAWATPTVATVDPVAATAARNSALGALTALLIALIGSVLGGWMASGEPMTLTHYRTREELVERRAA